MHGTIIKLKTAKKPNRAFAKRMKRQKLAGFGIGAVAVSLTALSLSHLAHGITLVTDAPAWEAWSMAGGIDLGFIACEMAQLNCATEKLAKHVSRFTKPAIVGTLIGSAIMNAFAFAAHATGYMVAPAVIFGIAIPGMIYALTRIGAALYIDCDSKK